MVPSGEMLGIAGRPGAGKTMLLRLLSCGLKPDGGEVLIDNVPLSALAPHDLSLNIGYKPQDPCLFEGSLKDNLRLGQPGLEIGAIKAALKAVGLMSALEQGELNLTTPVGPRERVLA